MGPTENKRWENQPGNLQDLRDYTALRWRHAGRAESLCEKVVSLIADRGWWEAG